MEKTEAGTRFNKLILMKILNGVAFSLIGIFIPIYILEIGYSFQDVIFYLMIHHGTLLLFTFVGAYIANKKGLVNLLKFRLIFTFAFIFILFNLNSNILFLFLMAFIRGIDDSFYWLPVNVLMVRNTNDQNIGEALAKFMAYPSLFTVFAPLIGGLIAVHFSFSVLIIIAFLVLISSVVPVLKMPTQNVPFEFSLSRSKEIYNQNKRLIIPEILDNLTETTAEIWTIFIYLKLIDVVQVGIVGTIMSLAAVFFTLTIGKMSDKFDKIKLLKFGAFFIFITWIFNAAIGHFTTNAWWFYIGSLMIAFLMKVFLVPYGAFLYNRARKDDIQFIVLREVLTVFGRMILFVLAIILQDNLPVLFAIVGLLFSYFIFFKPDQPANRLANSTVR